MSFQDYGFDLKKTTIILKDGVNLTKQLLFQLINQKMYMDLAFLLISYWISWWIVLALGLKIMEVKVGKAILLGAFIGALCTFFLKPLLPGFFSVLTLIIPLILLLKFYGKARLVVCCWLTFVLLLITIFGAALIDNSLSSINNKNIVHFLFETPFGISILALLENVFPAIALLFLKVLDISVMPSIENILTKVNFIDVYLQGAIFYWFYDSSIILLSDLVNNPRHPKMHLFAKWLISGGTLTGLMIRQIHFKKIQKKVVLNEKEKVRLQNKIQELTKDNQELININQELNEKVLKAQKSSMVNDNTNKIDTDILPVIKKKFYKIPDINGNPDKIKIGSSEMNVLLLIGFGKSNKEIVEITGLKDGTVRNLVTSLLDKLKCADRTQLAIYVTKNKIINIVNKE